MSGVQKFPDSYISNYNMEFTVEQELIFTIKTYLDSEEVKLEKIKKLFKMEDKPDINFQNEYKQTPLHLAVQKKELKVIELLLNHGANINIKNDQNMSPLDAAKLLNNTDIVNLLQSHIEQSYHQSMKEQNQPQINVTCISHQNMDSTHSVTNFEIQGCSDSNAIKKQKKQVPSIHGFIYQLKLLVLFLYQGVNQELSFRLGTEIEEAQKFDDLMFEYSEDGKKKYRLLQAKHRLDESKRLQQMNYYQIKIQTTV
ncbi:hypothetical protein HHI36_006774 [Cryptolaemus montrouzieri]|uniref:Uncharacterized protein n=1 Tax=Cryptolaemus montrouzieri TaxID=559131 RepID=A0ABD2NY58_9CUCU